MPADPEFERRIRAYIAEQEREALDDLIDALHLTSPNMRHRVMTASRVRDFRPFPVCLTSDGWVEFGPKNITPAVADYVLLRLQTDRMVRTIAEARNPEQDP